MLSLIQQQQGAISPSSALTCYTKYTTVFLSPVGPSNPNHREAVRTATSVLCKEMLQPEQRTGLGLRESEKVEARLRALARLEREWGKNDLPGNATQLGASRTKRDARAGVSGEEKERRLFVEAVRDGYVLCQ